MRTLPLAAALLLAAASAPLAGAAGSSSSNGCVFLAQDLDYRHYLCVNLTDPECAVYLWRVSGGHETKTCLAGGAIGSTVEPEASCIPTSGGLDYPSFLCVDPGNLLCPVYTITTSDWGVTKTCVPPPLA